MARVVRAALRAPAATARAAAPGAAAAKVAGGGGALEIVAAGRLITGGNVDLDAAGGAGASGNGGAGGGGVGDTGGAGASGSSGQQNDSDTSGSGGTGGTAARAAPAARAERRQRRGRRRRCGRHHQAGRVGARCEYGDRRRRRGQRRHDGQNGRLILGANTDVTTVPSGQPGTQTGVGSTLRFDGRTNTTTIISGANSFITGSPRTPNIADLAGGAGTYGLLPTTGTDGVLRTISVRSRPC
ncbi:MAG: hypothetical protein WDO24_04745 [Pseudomonadota bacterium]